MFDDQNTIPDLCPHVGKMPPEQFHEMAKVVTILGSYAARNYDGESYDSAAECIAVISGVLGEYAGCSCDTCYFMAMSIFEMMEEIHRGQGRANDLRRG